MTVVSLVPARGGSRGLPGKNLAEVGGRSLVARAVEAARRTPGVDEVLVSSDDEAILAEGIRAGAMPLTRPPALAGDETPTIDVVRAVLDLRTDVHVLVLLQPTSPLRTEGDIQACLDVLAPPRIKTVTTVTPAEHPVEWHFRLSPRGGMAPVLGWEGMPTRRQSALASYVLNGAVYAAYADHLRGGGALVERDTVGVVMDRRRSVDIDDALDLEYARLLHGPSHPPPAAS